MTDVVKTILRREVVKEPRKKRRAMEKWKTQKTRFQLSHSACCKNKVEVPAQQTKPP